jgi:hypothetical protein
VLIGSLRLLISCIASNMHCPIRRQKFYNFVHRIQTRSAKNPTSSEPTFRNPPTISPRPTLSPFCRNSLPWKRLHRPRSLPTPRRTATLNGRRSSTSRCLSHQNFFFFVRVLMSHQGILKGEVSLYHRPPVWVVWNQLYDYWQFLFLFTKQTNPNQSNRILFGTGTEILVLVQ